MAKYVVLVNLTEQALRDIKAAPDRTEGAKKLARELGGEMIESYFTMGQYDLVGIMDFPDDAAAAKYALSIGALGNARTTTLKAFTAAEFKEILSGLPD
jgi:uncharacterized protein with GYD domain